MFPRVSKVTSVTLGGAFGRIFGSISPSQRTTGSTGFGPPLARVHPRPLPIRICSHVCPGRRMKN